MAFYDKGSKSFSVYDFAFFKACRESLKEWVSSTKLDKASMYIKDFDSIFVTTQTKLIYWTVPVPKRSALSFLKNPIKEVFFSNVAPPVMVVVMCCYEHPPFIDERFVEAQKKWRVLYGIDVQSGDKERYYQLPEV